MSSKADAEHRHTRVEQARVPARGAVGVGARRPAGPPERTIAAGSRASSSATLAVCGTISEYTCASRTRRAISCAYCAPKSTTSTGRGSTPRSLRLPCHESACGGFGLPRLEAPTEAGRDHHRLARRLRLRDRTPARRGTTPTVPGGTVSARTQTGASRSTRPAAKPTTTLCYPTVEPVGDDAPAAAGRDGVAVTLLTLSTTSQVDHSGETTKGLILTAKVTVGYLRG